MEVVMEYETLIERLKELRKIKKVSCRDLAAAMEKTRGYIYIMWKMER